MAKRITICAGIDTGKRKLDVALDGSSERTQVDNTPEGHTVLLEWLKRLKVKPGASLSLPSCAGASGPKCLCRRTRPSPCLRTRTDDRPGAEGAGPC